MLFHLLCAQDALRGIGEVKVLQERSLTGTWDIRSLQRWKWGTAENAETSKIVQTDIIRCCCANIGRRHRSFAFTYHVFFVVFRSENTACRSCGDFTVTISPKEIRTFFIHFSSSNVSY